VGRIASIGPAQPDLRRLEITLAGRQDDALALAAADRVVCALRTGEHATR
jgi:hypothetical protein